LGLSVVIINDRERIVYKVPLEDKASVSLHELNEINCSSFPQFLVPRETFHPAIGLQYFKFDILKGCMEPEQAKLRLSTYVYSVLGALQEFHELGYAHLDVRLENICFGEDDKAVLDRCMVASELVEQYEPPSLMYPFHKTWTFKKWDYVQLNLIII